MCSSDSTSRALSFLLILLLPRKHLTLPAARQSPPRTVRQHCCDLLHNCYHPLELSTVQTRIMTFPNTQTPHPLLHPPDTSVTTASCPFSVCRFPAPTLPLVNKWKDMIGTAFSLAIVSYVINLAMGRTLAAKHGYDVDPNQVTLGLEGRTQGPFPLLRRERRNSLHEWEAFKEPCCSHAGSQGSLPCGGQKDMADPPPTGWREDAKGRKGLG